MNSPIVTKEVRSWLPKAAVGDGKLAQALESAVALWAINWFVAHSRNLSFTHNDDSTGTTNHGLGVAWCCASNNLCVTLSNSGRRQLAACMLDIDLGEHRLTSTDSHIIGKLTLPAIEDLIGRLAKCLEISGHIERLSAVAFASQVSRSYEHFSIGFDAPGSSIDFYISSQSALSARRALTQPIRANPELVSRATAIEGQSVYIGALIGSTQLGYVDLYGLGVGDVIVLDKCLTEAIEVTINGQGRSNVACEIDEDNGQTKLRLVAT